MDFKNTSYIIKQSQQLIHLAMSKALRPVPLTLPQYAVLTFLHSEGPLTGAQLARAAFVTPQTMHTILMTLENNGLIQRLSKPGDDKSLNVVLSEAGKQRLAMAESALEVFFSLGNNALTSDEHKQLYALLARLDDSLMDAG